MEPGIWLVLMVVLVIIELLTVGLTTIWFAAGALVAYLCTLLGANLAVQIIVFLVVSVVLFLLTRPILVKRLNKSRTKTNVDSLIGQEARVTEVIDPFRGTGTAMLDGKVWTARSNNDQVIDVDTKVKVLAVEGVKLIVEAVPVSLSEDAKA